VKPADYPEFFERPPPDGRSRESTIVLLSDGRFLHDGEPVRHEGMRRAFAGWIARHPQNGRFILNNGYDWCYLRVEDTPYFVTSIHATTEEQLSMELADGSQEPLDPHRLGVRASGELCVRVKGDAFVAKFSRVAQLAMAQYLSEDSTGRPVFSYGRASVPIRPFVEPEGGPSASS
jgi:hypothetical protein